MASLSKPSLSHAPSGLVLYGLLLLTQGGGAAGFAGPVITDPPIFAIAPGQVDVGAEFWVDILLGSEWDPVVDLFGVSFELVYATSVSHVSVLADEAGTLLGPTPLYFTRDEGDRLAVAVTRLSGEGSVGGYGLIMRVRFSADSEGLAFLRFENVKANGPDGTPIALDPGEAPVQIGGHTPQLSARVFLEGPFDGGSMQTGLLAAGLVPQAHPYGEPPWGYPGPEWTASIPDQVVDWVLVALLRGDPALPPVEWVAGRAAFLLADGTIVDLDETDVDFPHVPAGTYFVAVDHRNHVAVMSAAPVNFGGGSASYDFTASQATAYGSSAMSEVAPGVFALMAGDADGNNQVQNTDKNLLWAPDVGKAGYLSSDFDLNGQIQNTDKNLLWAPNVGKGTQLPPLVGR